MNARLASQAKHAPIRSAQVQVVSSIDTTAPARVREEVPATTGTASATASIPILEKTATSAPALVIASDEVSATKLVASASANHLSLGLDVSFRFVQPTVSPRSKVGATCSLGNASVSMVMEVRHAERSLTVKHFKGRNSTGTRFGINLVGRCVRVANLSTVSTGASATHFLA